MSLWWRVSSKSVLQSCCSSAVTGLKADIRLIYVHSHQCHSWVVGPDAWSTAKAYVGFLLRCYSDPYHEWAKRRSLVIQIDYERGHNLLRGMIGRKFGSLSTF